MKKILYLILAGCIIAGGFLIWKRTFVNDDIDPAVFLPEEVILYTNQRELGSILGGFSKTILAEKLKDIDYAKISLDIELPLEFVQKIQNIKNIVNDSLTRHIVEELVSRNVSIALLPGNRFSSPEDYLQRNLLVIAKPAHNARILEIIVSTLSDNFDIITSLYGNYLIHRFLIGGELALTAAAAEGYIVMALDDRTLRESLDRFDSRDLNLGNNPDYKLLRDQYSTAQSFSLFSIDNFISFLKKTSSSDSGEDIVQRYHLKNWQGFGSGALGSWYKTDKRRDVVTLLYDPQKVTQQTGHFLKQKPEKDYFIKKAPKDTFLYYWTNTFDLETLAALFQHELGINEQRIQSQKNRFLQLTSLKFDEAMKLIGNNVGIIVMPASQVNFIPLPNLTIVIEVLNQDIVLKTLKNIIVNNEIPHGQKTYKDIELTFWGEFVQQGLQPTYAVHENTLYISSSVKTMQNVITTLVDGHGMVAQNTFKKSVGNFLYNDNNSNAYLKVPVFLDNVKELISWAGTMLALEDKKAAEHTKIIIEQVIQPIIEGLRMYTHIFTRSSVEAGIITIETETTVKQR